MENDCISREAAIDLLKRLRKDGDMIPWEGKKVFHSIRNLPAADVRPVVHGHWEDRGSLSARCSECGCKSLRASDFCPNCGADMREGRVKDE